MTGGVTEYLDVQHEIKTQSKQALWKSLYEAYKMGSLSGSYQLNNQFELNNSALNIFKAQI